MHGTRPEHATGMEAESVMDRGRQLADVDPAGFDQIALANGAGDRLRGEPDFLRERGARGVVLLLFGRHRAGPVLQGGDRFGPGHALGPHEPVHTTAVLTAAETMPM